MELRVNAPRVVPRSVWDKVNAVLAFASWRPVVTDPCPRPTGTLPLVQSLKRRFFVPAPDSARQQEAMTVPARNKSGCAH